MAPRFLFGPSFRLKKGWEFDAVFRTGRQVRGEMVRLYFLRRPGERSRVGVTVGKKIANAVKRSRGRRLLRESLRRLLPWIKDGFWFVLSMREKALETDAVTVYADAARVLDRAGLLDSGWGGGDWPADARRFF
ncbi:MAG: ribonuclease P protein component [Synergistaceae bacterium]|nr:ribonuclease P protein component [Synergistaceae bacterium]